MVNEWTTLRPKLRCWIGLFSIWANIISYTNFYITKIKTIIQLSLSLLLFIWNLMVIIMFLRLLGSMNLNTLLEPFIVLLSCLLGFKLLFGCLAFVFVNEFLSTFFIKVIKVFFIGPIEGWLSPYEFIQLCFPLLFFDWVFYKRIMCIIEDLFGAKQNLPHCWYYIRLLLSRLIVLINCEGQLTFTIYYIASVGKCKRLSQSC